MRTQRRDAGLGQGGDVDHAGRLEALGIGQHVTEQQPAFGVIGSHLDGLAGHRSHHVAGSAAMAAGHVLGRGDQADDVERQTKPGDRAQRAEHAAGTAHAEPPIRGLGARRRGEVGGTSAHALADEHDRLA